MLNSFWIDGNTRQPWVDDDVLITFFFINSTRRYFREVTSSDAVEHYNSNYWMSEPLCHFISFLTAPGAEDLAETLNRL